MKPQTTNHKPQKYGLFLTLIFTLTIFSSLISPSAHAKVTGPCVNCHTMHNSQGGSSMHTGYGADEAPYATLLRANGCVGCHTSSVSGEWKNSMGAPIVYNTVEPSDPLAGGNYYWVKNTGDAYGHNPVEIGAADVTLTSTPGGYHSYQVRCSGGGGTGAGMRGCHGNRFLENDATMKGFHHANDGGTLITASTVANSFRGILGVKGVEDPDWENAPATSHNLYSGSASPTVITCNVCHGSAPTQYNTISGFCGSCHGHFHQLDDVYQQGEPGTQSNDQWVRHPSDILLPETGEYSAYTTYSVEVPMGYTDVSAPTRATATVTCISCHRAHGSPYPDMLRWDYNDMNAGGGGSGGCFTCHTQKND